MEGCRPRPKPRKSGGRRWEAQNFARFFPLPLQFSFFSSLSGGLVEFWWCAHDNHRIQTCTFEGPFKHHQNSTRRPPEREERILRREREKKERNLGGSGEGLGRAVREGWSGGTEHDQTKTLKPTPTHETHSMKPAPTPHSTNTHTTHNKSNPLWTNSVLAKVGHTTKTPTLAKVGLAKLGLAKVGHDRSIRLRIFDV